jgi:hypothetical protein
VNSSQIAALVERVIKLPAEYRSGLLLALLERWHELDPDAAAAWVRPAIARAYATAGKAVPAHEGLDEEIVKTWSEAAPEAALAQAARQPDAPSSERIVVFATRALAGLDFAARVEKLAALQNGAVRDHALAETLKSWAATDPAAAYAQIDRLSPGKESDDARRAVLTEMAKRDVSTTLARLSELVPDLPADPQGNELINQVLREAAQHDGATATQWASALPEGLREKATAAALINWARNDGLAALQWANARNLPFDTRSRWRVSETMEVQQTLLQAVAGKPEAVAWLRSLPPDAEIDRVLQEQAFFHGSTVSSRELFSELPSQTQPRAAEWLVRAIAKEDAADAIRWTSQLPNGEAREKAVGTLAWDLAENAGPTSALLEELLTGPDRDVALRAYADRITPKEPAKSLELAAQIADADVREQAFRYIASSWLYGDETAARAWLAGTSELSAATKANLLRSMQDRQLEYSR